jgi:uncharacterized protein
MNYFDIVWQNTKIDDPIAIEIINHPSMQRLKNIWISTYGYLFNLKRNATRFDHSIGVYLLLKKYGALQKEQIAGLVHDVSHTALSHVSTYAIQGKYEGKEFHELMQQEFINNSGLGSLLNKQGYEVKEMLHTDEYTLLENELPDICADRIDYAIRDGLHLQTLTRQQANKILAGLATINGEFTFKDEESAFLYSFNFYLLNLMFYGSPTEAHFNNDFGSLVKRAMELEIIEEKDWFSDDIYITNKLKSSNNKEIKGWLEKYNNKLVIYEDTENPDVTFPKKIRIVDPKVKTRGGVSRLSEISAVYNKIINDYKKTHKKHELAVKIDYKK